EGQGLPVHRRTVTKLLRSCASYPLSRRKAGEGWGGGWRSEDPYWTAGIRPRYARPHPVDALRASDPPRWRAGEGVRSVSIWMDHALGRDAAAGRGAR